MRVFGLISGAIGGLGAVVLIQQYGIAPLGRALTLQGLIGGALVGIVVPSIVFALVVRKYNRKLAEARGRLPRGPAASPGVGAAVLFVMLIGTFAAFGTGAAHAEGQGPCRLIVEGRDVAGLKLTASDAILVESESSFIASMSWPSDFASFEVRFFYAGFSYGFGDSEVDEDASDGGADSGTVELPVDLFFQYAGGLYEVHVDGVLVNGQSCNFAMLFDVDRNPLETVVGKVAAATAAVGAIGVLGVGAAAAVDGTRMVGDLTSILSDPRVGTVVDPTGQVPPIDKTGPVDTSSPSAKKPPGGPAEPAGGGAPEPRVSPDTVEPPAKAAPQSKVSSDTGMPAAESLREPKVSPDAAGPAAGASSETTLTPDSVEQPADSGPEPTEIPAQPIEGDAAPDGAVTEPPAAGASEPSATDAPPTQLGAGDSVADAPGLGGEPPAGEVPPPAATIVEPSEPSSWEPGGGVPGVKAGMAAGALLTPALLGSLKSAAKGRSSGVASTTVAFWFYVAQPAPLFGLEDYNTIVGELSPGSWHMGQGTYGEWVHAVDGATKVEGWVAAQAAQPAS